MVNELEKSSLEEKFFNNNDILKLPELIEIYYAEGKYPLVYYLSKMYENELQILSFYKMLALIELDRLPEAKALYESKYEEWLNLCKQYNVYWKYIILFLLYFKVEYRPKWLIDIIDIHYDCELVQFLELTESVSLDNLYKLPLYINILMQYPKLKKIYSIQEENKSQNISNQDRKLKWSYWEKYNSALISKPLDENYICCLYSDEEIKIYSYKPHQIAASMHILTDGQNTLIFDCGAEICQDGIKCINLQSVLNDLGITKVDGIFISHGHLDHYGSLNENLYFPCYMTEDTLNIIKRVSPNILLRNVNLKRMYETTNINGIKIKSIPNGHILGSVLFDINWNDQKRIIYTGDYCLEDQKSCSGLDIKTLMSDQRTVDILLTESTYGQRHEILSLKEYEQVFSDVCELVIKHGKKVIIPSFAVGRAVETALLLENLVKEKGYKILIDGLAANLTEYYQNSMGRSIIGSNISVCRDDLELIEKISSYDVIIASSGMMKPGSTSYQYLQEMLGMSNICVIKVGFIHKYEDMLISVFNRRGKNVTFFDIPLSAHAYYDNLTLTLDSISPNLAIYVHGQWIDTPKI